MELASISFMSFFTIHANHILYASSCSMTFDLCEGFLDQAKVQHQQLQILWLLKLAKPERTQAQLKDLLSFLIKFD